MPKTQLEPDILVYSAEFPVGAHWREISGHWLAVEVLSLSSRLYDREFKRDAYLALGVRQVWLVDWRNRCVEISSVPGKSRTVRDAIRWRSPAGITVSIDVNEVFSGTDDLDDYES